MTDVRMRESALRNLTHLKNVCGEAAYNHLALFTTKWECFGDGDRDIALQRETELENNWQQCRLLLDEAEDKFRKALVERRDEHAEVLSRQREELNAKMLEAERNQEELRAHHESILDAQRAEDESALRDRQQQRDNADRRQLEMEKEIETISKALDERRQEFESQRREYEVRIEVLERQNRDFEAKLERSRIAQQEAAYRARRQGLVEYHDELSVDYRRACQGYQQCRVACAGFAGVVKIINNYVNVSR
ncbi:MAG: hypothetical protein Q9204_003793 [Flavoplaca sp. TL-2023a]